MLKKIDSELTEYKLLMKVKLCAPILEGRDKYKVQFENDQIDTGEKFSFMGKISELLSK